MIKDQAHHLRQLSNSIDKNIKPSHVITIASGKGGVGKSNFALGFAFSLIELGKKVVLIDFDLGMANLDILMGVTPKFHLLDMIRQQKTIWDILELGPNGIEYLAGGSGFDQLLQLDMEERNYFFGELEKLHGYADYIIIDTGAGLTMESQQCHLSADDVILLTTPEPTALADAYSVVKMLHSRRPSMSFQLVVNRVSKPSEGMEVASKFKLAVKTFLNKDLKIFGAIPEDKVILQSVLKQVPFYLAAPNAPASVRMKKLSERYVGSAIVPVESDGIKGFIRRLALMMKR